MCPKDSDGMANSVNLDQAAPSVWSGSTLVWPRLSIQKLRIMTEFQFIYEPCHEKTCHMWTTKPQISLRIHAVWSVPLFFTAWLVQYLYLLHLHKSLQLFNDMNNFCSNKKYFAQWSIVFIFWKFKHDWLTNSKHLSQVMRKPFYTICKQQRCRSACAVWSAPLFSLPG